MTENDGLEFFLKMNRGFFENMLNDMHKEKRFKKSDGVTVLTRVGWSLSIFNEMKKHDWSEKQFESVGTFRVLFRTVCEVVKKLISKHMDVFKISLKTINAKFDYYEKYLIWSMHYFWGDSNSCFTGLRLYESCCIRRS